MKLRLLGSIFSGLFVFAFTSCTTAFGQVSINGSLRGRINDPVAAPVVGASAILTSVATATTQTTTTDGAGGFVNALIGGWSLAGLALVASHI